MSAHTATTTLDFGSLGEFTVRIEFTACRGYPATREDPGCDDEIELDGVFIVPFDEQHDQPPPGIEAKAIHAFCEAIALLDLLPILDEDTIKDVLDPVCWEKLESEAEQAAADRYEANVDEDWG